MAIIMISRGTFSGGKIVAEGVASRLGYPCISKEIVLDAAEEFGVPEDKLIANLAAPPRLWRGNPSKRFAHLNFVTAALLKRAENDNIVYHGYAGHLLLNNIPHVLRVRIIADNEYRIQRAMSWEGLSRKQAIKKVENMDSTNSKWTQYLYGVNWKDPSLYDMTLNLEQIDSECAIETIVHASKLSAFEFTPESHESLSNILLSSLVWAELSKDERTCHANLNVSAQTGVITITGSAKSTKDINAISFVANKVTGVNEVINRVGVGSQWLW